MSLKILSLDDIVVSEDRQRKYFPEQEMQELRSSILSDLGLLAPIVVHPQEDGKFKLIAGERRYRTIQSLNRSYMFGDQELTPEQIPAVVRTMHEEVTQYEAELHENVVRLQLTWQEQADAVARLHKYKKSIDPRHSVGMTAKLIETKETTTDYARPVTYAKVNQSLLVSDFLHLPEVQSAPNLEAATRIVTRRIEESAASEFTASLKQLQKEAIQQKAQIELNKSFAEDCKEEDAQVNFDFLVPDKELGEFYHASMLDILPTIPDGSINVVITDPPYGIGVEKFNNAGNSASISNVRHYSEENFRELHQTLVTELDRICTTSAHVYIFCDIGFFPELKTYFSEQWRVRRVPLVWNSGGSGFLESGEKWGFRRTSEFVLFATRGSRPGSFVTQDIINIPASNQKIHADQKPDELYGHFMRMSCIPGDRVLDPFAGSGTIFRAAKKHNVVPIGIELNDKYAAYCKMAQRYTAEPVVGDAESLSDLTDLFTPGAGNSSSD